MLFLGYSCWGSQQKPAQGTILLGGQVSDLKSSSQADPGKQLAFPPGVSELFQDSFTERQTPAGNFQKSLSVI